MVKNPPANAGDLGLIPAVGGGEDPLKEEMATHSSILAWKIPWSQAGYSLWGHKESDTAEKLSRGTHTHTSVSNLLWQNYQSYRRCYNGETEGRKGIEELSVLSLQLFYKAKIIPRQKADLKNIL